MDAKLSEDVKLQIFEFLKDTCRIAEEGIEYFDLEGFCEAEDITEIMLGYNYECCPGCGWWIECSDMDNEGFCLDCTDSPIDDEYD